MGFLGDFLLLKLEKVNKVGLPKLTQRHEATMPPIIIRGYCISWVPLWHGVRKKNHTMTPKGNPRIHSRGRGTRTAPKESDSSDFD